MRTLISAIVVLAIGALPAAASDCKKKDIAGKWEIYGQTVYSTAAIWFNCSVIIKNKQGNAAPGSTCELNIGLVFPMNTGNFQVDNNCNITGSFDASGDNSFEFTKGLMSMDKETMAGAGQSDYGAFTYSAVRRK